MTLYLEPAFLNQFRNYARELQELTAKPANLSQILYNYERSKNECLTLISQADSCNDPEIVQEIEKTDKLVQEKMAALSKNTLDRFRESAQEIQRLWTKPTNFNEIIERYQSARKECLNVIDEHRLFIGHEYAQEMVKTDALVQQRLIALSQSYSSYFSSSIAYWTTPLPSEVSVMSGPRSLVEEMREALKGDALKLQDFAMNMKQCQDHLKKLTDTLGQGPANTLFELNVAYKKVQPKAGFEVKDISFIVGELTPRIEQSCSEVRIYHKPGDENTISATVAMLEKHTRAEIKLENIHDLTGLLKTILRQMKQPLFSFKAFSDAIYPRINEEKLIKNLAALPAENRELLHKLIGHLHNLSHHQESNKMTSDHLGVCFAPLLFDQDYSPTYSNFMSNMVAYLIDHPKLAAF